MRRRVLFSGRIQASQRLLKRVSIAELMGALDRHESGDWGHVSGETKRANEEAMWSRGRVRSAYRDSRGTEFWIFTEVGNQETFLELAEW